MVSLSAIRMNIHMCQKKSRQIKYSAAGRLALSMHGWFLITFMAMPQLRVAPAGGDDAFFACATNQTIVVGVTSKNH